MAMPEMGSGGRNQSTGSTARENRMDAPNDVIFELLEQNTKWWERAALTCEHLAAHSASATPEEWQLMGAVYRERAEKHARLIDQLREG